MTNIMHYTVQKIQIDEAHEGQRLDNFLMARLKGVPKSLIYRIIRKGEVRINKGRVKQTTRLQLHDIVRIPPIRMTDKPTQGVSTQKYTFLQACILYEDDAVLVLNKPSGMAVHAGSGVRVGVIEALRALRSDLPYLELVHRLDRETSGCLLLAKKRSALRVLHEHFSSQNTQKKCKKTYLCLVKGRWRYGDRQVRKSLDTENRKHAERYVAVSESGVFANSYFSPVSCHDDVSLMQVTLGTGRTHQIRVHAQSENHPVAGDRRYGDEGFNKVMKKSGLHRLFLHAYRLNCPHPSSQKMMRWQAPLPEDLAQILPQWELSL